MKHRLTIYIEEAIYNRASGFASTEHRTVNDWIACQISKIAHVASADVEQEPIRWPGTGLNPIDLEGVE